MRTFIPLAQSAIDALINHLAQPTHNGGPPLDEVSEAIRCLRELHTRLGKILEIVEGDNTTALLGEGLLAEAARYSKRAAKALRGDPLPYALSATVLAIMTACGFPGIGGYLGGIALAMKKPQG